MQATPYTSLYGPNQPPLGLRKLGLMEQRFPLATRGDIPALERIWERSKDTPWNPRKAIPYEQFDRSKYSTEQLDAARLCWSRRAWTEYTGIIEVPAMLVRLCIDGQLPIHAKFSLAAKIMEEARHCEASFLLAEAMGGYVQEPPPGDAIMRMVVAGFRDRLALNPDVTPMAGMVAWHIISEGIALDIFAARYKNTNEPVTREVIRLIMQDEVRHVEMGWILLDHFFPTMTRRDLQAIQEVVTDIVENVEMKGFHSMCLLTDSETSLMRQAEAIAGDAKLGFCSAAQEHIAFVESMTKIRERLRKYDIVIPLFKELELAA